VRPHHLFSSVRPIWVLFRPLCLCDVDFSSVLPPAFSQETMTKGHVGEVHRSLETKHVNLGRGQSSKGRDPTELSGPSLPPRHIHHQALLLLPLLLLRAPLALGSHLRTGLLHRLRSFLTTGMFSSLMNFSLCFHVMFRLIPSRARVCVEDISANLT
jgi:hypothetical protein